MNNCLLQQKKDRLTVMKVMVEKWRPHYVQILILYFFNDDKVTVYNDTLKKPEVRSPWSGHTWKDLYQELAVYYSLKYSHNVLCAWDIWWMTLWLHWSHIKMPLEFIQRRCALYLSLILKLHCNSNFPRRLLMLWHWNTTQDFWIHCNNCRDQILVREAWVLFQTCSVDHPNLMPLREHILKVSRSRSNLMEPKWEQGELAASWLSFHFIFKGQEKSSFLSSVFTWL